MDDEAAAVILALIFAFQSTWNELRRTGRLHAASTTRVYTREDAISLGRVFGNRFLARARPVHEADSWLLRSVSAIAGEIQGYESSHLRELALNIIPFDQLHAEATTFMQEEALEYQDALAQALVKWAKRDFLKWADPVKCAVCGGPTDGVAGGSPNPEEQRHGAGRVELYRCISETSPCRGSITRFPRYSSLEKLLETRTGRCGEFAAVFMLLLRALNFRARYIWNSEDHVWNEYYSEALKRWVHLDSCEGARDKNLLYDRGWGKKMKYCIAFGIDGAVDVTKSYISDWQETLSRRDSRLEATLASELQRVTSSLRNGRMQEEIHQLQQEDLLEQEWLDDFRRREEIASKERLGGRTSGTREWRSQREELGQAAKNQLPVMKATKTVASLSDISGLSLNGSSKFDNQSCQITLTADSPSQTGSAFLELPAELEDFIFTTTFRIKHRAADGADGMALVLHADPRGEQALGEGGCHLGYGGLQNCIAIEIDTYRSQDRCDDPPTPHISVQSAGENGNSAHHRHSLWCTKPGTLPPLDDGREYAMKVEVSLTRLQLRLFLNDGAERDFVELRTQPIYVPTLPRAEKRWIGWTAATGGLHQEHVITGFTLSEGEAPRDEVNSITKDVALDTV